MNKSENTTKPNALIIGVNSSIAKALILQLGQTHRVATLSRQQTDYTERSLLAHFRIFSALGDFNRIICCVDGMQDSTIGPEKNLNQVTAGRLAHYFQVNTILPMICLKVFHPLLSRKESAVFACLGAMDESIRDKRLGGSYGFRSANAALNMLVNTTSTEVALKNKGASIITLHSGTTERELSAPYSGNVNQANYYSPKQSASMIIKVMAGLARDDSGLSFNWDGAKITQ